MVVDVMWYVLGSFECIIMLNDDVDIVFASNLSTGWFLIVWIFFRYMIFFGCFEVK